MLSVEYTGAVKGANTKFWTFGVVMLRIQKPAPRKTGEGDIGGNTNASGAPW